MILTTPILGPTPEQLGRCAVERHKQSPGSFEDEELVSLNVPECSNTPDFLSKMSCGIT